MDHLKLFTFEHELLKYLRVYKPSFQQKHIQLQGSGWPSSERAVVRKCSEQEHEEGGRINI
jgi:hypothetical protein